MTHLKYPSKMFTVIYFGFAVFDIMYHYHKGDLTWAKMSQINFGYFILYGFQFGIINSLSLIKEAYNKHRHDFKNKENLI